MKGIRTVLFDLGNVLVHFHPDRFWQTLGETDEARIADLKPKAFDLGKIYESGEMSTQDFWVAFSRLIGNGVPRKELEKAFLSVLPEPVHGMEDLVRRLSRSYELGLVSNTNPVHFGLCLSTIPALRCISRFYLSYEVRCLKPGDGFYKAVLSGEQAEPEEMVFIDDIQENVEAARRVGLHALQFRGRDTLVNELSAIGVLVR